MLDKIILKNINKSFGDQRVLRDFSAELYGSGRYALMGRSGIGKTTLLRIILGLEVPDSGELRFEMNDVPDKIRGPVRKEKPSFSAVFQEDRLFPGADAVSNICAVTRGLEKRQVLEELSIIAPDIDLHTAADELSGGQRRRTAVLRALLHPSDALIMDEPFSGLDEAAKERLMDYISTHMDGRILIISTHEGEDALRLGCEIIKLDKEQI